MKRYILEQGDLLFIHNTNKQIVRVLNLKTSEAIETANTRMIQKTMEHGEECTAPLDNGL